MIHKLSAQNANLGINMRQDLNLLRADLKRFMNQFRYFSADDNNTGVQLANKLSSLRLECDFVARTNAVLGSLSYDAIYYRHEQIAKAHAKTFEWIFQEDHIDTTKSPVPAFGRWLRHGDGIYWISGKPGSGKSTLVKWICQQERTRHLLQAWASHRTLVVATHFFWSVGTDMQKSQEGLLRSLLFEALRGCPDLTPHIVGDRWDEGQAFSQQRPWTISELKECLTRLATADQTSVAFCFFVDGLGEYSGEYDADHEAIIGILQAIAESRQVKICVSSRPWNVFQAAFSCLVGQRLRLEDLTSDNIRLFTRERLGENPNFQKMAEREPRCETFVDEIAAAADGVFLWVFLVVRSLLKGLNNADRLSTLQRRLLALPTDLEKLFLHMLNTTDEAYYEEQACFFTIAHHAHGPLSLTTYSYIDEEDPKFAFDSATGPESTAERLDRLRLTKIRLNARCNGLVECISAPKSTDADRLLEMTTEPTSKYLSPVLLSKGYEVRFLHRTVRDFIATQEVGSLLARRCPKDFRPSVRVCLAFLAEIKRLDFHMADERLKLILSHLLGKIAPYLQEAEVKYSAPVCLQGAEVKYSRPMLNVLDALQEVFARISADVTAAVLASSTPETLKTISTKSGELGFESTSGISRRVILQCKPPGFSYFVIQSRLILYTGHKLQTGWATPEMADLIFCALLPCAKNLCATHTQKEELAMLETLLDHFGNSVLSDSPRVTETRTHHGQTFEKYQASRWLIFLGIVTDIWSTANTEDADRDDLIYRKIMICLKAGADPNVRELGNEASLPMLVRLLRTASSMVPLRSRAHTLVYRVLELFLKHGADLREKQGRDEYVPSSLRRDIYTSLDDDAWKLAFRFGFTCVEAEPEPVPEEDLGADTPWVNAWHRYRG